MVTRAEAVSRIQEGLGFRSDKADTILSRLGSEQRLLENDGLTLPKFLLLEDQTLSLTSGSSSVALPANFLRRADRLLSYTPTDASKPVTIPWKGYNYAFAAYSDADAAGPKVAVLRGSAILFFPEADTDYTIDWDYYKTDTAVESLEADETNLWLTHAEDLLIGGAGLAIAKDLRNKEATALFADMQKRGRLSMFGKIISDETDDDVALGSDN